MSEKGDVLREERLSLSKQIQEIDKKLQVLEIEERRQSLQKHVGRYYRNPEKYSITLYYVIGIDSRVQRNVVIELTQYGRGKDAWFALEKHDAIYEMKNMKPATKAQFNALLKKIRPFTKKHK